MDRALPASIELVDRAREAGVIRPDFDHSDLYLLTQANAGLVKGTRRSPPNAWRRFGGYMLQAFRAEQDAGSLPPPAIVLTRTQATS